MSKAKRAIRRGLKVLLWAIAAGMVIAIGSVIGLGWAVYSTAKTLPDYEAIQNVPTGTTVRVFSANNQLIHREGPAYGKWLKYNQIPLTMRQAIVSIEDRRYRIHYGVDPIAIARAAKFAWDNRNNDRRMQGASTITQQLSRTIFLSREYNLKRKIDEMIVAFAMEQKFSKDEILELYLNRIYFGGGAYGIDAASRSFFDHPATKMTMQESALLAGLVKAPSNYAPTADAEAAIGRMGVVLAKMEETGQVNALPSKLELPQIFAEQKEQQTETRHFTDWVMKQIDELAPNS